MLAKGEKVKVMYPYDAMWWETKGIVISYDGDNCYRIEDFRGGSNFN